MADNSGEPLLGWALSKLGPYAPGAAGAVLSMAEGAREVNGGLNSVEDRMRQLIRRRHLAGLRWCGWPS